MVNRASALKASGSALLLTVFVFCLLFLLPFRREDLEGANDDSSLETQNNETPI